MPAKRQPPLPPQRNLAEYGAFIDIGAANDGLLHISNMSTGFVKSPADLLEVGQDIEVRVLSVDSSSGKFSLTMKPEGENSRRPGEAPKARDGNGEAPKVQCLTAAWLGPRSILTALGCSFPGPPRAPGSPRGGSQVYLWPGGDRDRCHGQGGGCFRRDR